jgi:hypothetical protein
MAIDLPDLDNRTYADLVEEARASIPLLYRSWTDHNPSDPGITLVELFAWLTEMVLYRTNRVTDQGYDVFLKILRSDPAWQLPAGEELGDAVKDTLASIRERYRAVTTDDYEFLVMTQEWSASVARVRCIAQRNLEALPPNHPRPAHMSVILVPPLVNFDALWDPQFSADHQPSAALIQLVKGFLKLRRILTTQVHVVGPTYYMVPATATLYLTEGFAKSQVLASALAGLRAYFHPLTGGADKKGWPFGRAVYVSDVYAVLDGIAGVDFVTDLDLPVSDSLRILLNEDSDLVGVRLLEHELVKIEVEESNFIVKERVGDQWL